MNIKRFLLLGIVALYAIIPAWGQAQKVEIRGSVIDDEGEPAISIVIRDHNEKGDVYGIQTSTESSRSWQIPIRPCISRDLPTHQKQ